MKEILKQRKIIGMWVWCDVEGGEGESNFCCPFKEVEETIIFPIEHDTYFMLLSIYWVIGCAGVVQYIQVIYSSNWMFFKSLWSMV